jgi:ABC transporter family protein
MGATGFPEVGAMSRRLRLGLLTVFAAFAGIALMLFILQILSRPSLRTRWDLSAQGNAGLSERTATALANLPEGSRAVAFLGYREDRSKTINGSQVYDRAFARLRTLLEDARIRSNGNLEVTLLEPFSSPVDIERVQSELNREPLEVLILVTPEGQKRKFLFSELFITTEPGPDGSPARLVQERVDSALGDAATRLASGRTYKAGLVTGYGQPPIDTEAGLRPLLRLLQSEGLDVIKITGPAVQAELDVMLIIGQQSAFVQSDAAAMRSWLEAGKPLFLCLGPFAPDEVIQYWNDLLAEQGLQFGKGTVCEARPEFRVYPGTSQVATLELKDHQLSGQHPVTLRLSTSQRPQLFTGMRPILIEGGGNLYSRAPLARTREKAWTDTDFDFAPGPTEPLGIQTLVAAAEKWQSESTQSAGRIVLFGSAVSLTGRYLTNLHELVTSSMRWLIGLDEAPAGLVALKSLPFRPSREDQIRMTNLSTLALPGFTLLLALLVFWRRRR